MLGANASHIPGPIGSRIDSEADPGRSIDHRSARVCRLRWHSQRRTSSSPPGPAEHEPSSTHTGCSHLVWRITASCITIPPISSTPEVIAIDGACCSPRAVSRAVAAIGAPTMTQSATPPRTGLCSGRRYRSPDRSRRDRISSPAHPPQPRSPTFRPGTSVQRSACDSLYLVCESHGTDYPFGGRK